MSIIEHDSLYKQAGFVRADIDADGEPWWAAVADGKFMLPNCESCGNSWFPGTPRCPRCASDSVSWKSASTEGVIHSWIVVHKALDSAFVRDTPYTIVAVELEAGGRMFGRLLSGRAEIGLSVVARSYDSGDQRLVGFAATQ